MASFFDVGSKRIGITLDWDGKKALAGMNQMEASFNRLKRIVMTVLAGKVVKEVSNFGREMTMMSIRTGQSISNLSKLRSSFVAAGVGAKGFERVIGNISDGLLGLSMGQGEFASKLGMLGISPYLNGRLKTEQEVLGSIADWSLRQKMSGRSERDILYRLRTLFQIPDEIGQKLLNGSKAYLDGLEDGAKKVGVLEEEEKDRLFKLNTSINQLGDSVGITTSKIISEFQPALQKVIDWATSVTTFAGKHQAESGIVAQGLGIFAGGIATIGIGKAIGSLLGAAIPGATAVGGATLGATMGLATAIGLGLEWLAVQIGKLVGWLIIKAWEYGKKWIKQFAESDFIQSFIKNVKDIPNHNPLNVIAGALGLSDLTKENEALEYYKVNGKLDLEHLKNDYDKNIIDPVKDKYLYNATVRVLRNAYPNRYNVDGSFIPANIEQAVSGNGDESSKTITINSEVNLNGAITPEAVDKVTEQNNNAFGLVLKQEMT